MFPSRLAAKPSWIPSDVLWFDIYSLKNLFHSDDSLSHLSEVFLSNEEAWKEWLDNPRLTTIPSNEKYPLSDLDKFVLLRLCRPDQLMIELKEYLVEYFHLNDLQTKDLQLKGIHMVNIPSIPLKSTEAGEYLVNSLDFDHSLVKIFQAKGRKVREIDCPTTETISETSDANDLIYFKHLPDHRFSPLIKHLRRKISLSSLSSLDCRSSFVLGQSSSLDVWISKTSSVDVRFFGAELHHYDCLLKEKVRLSDLLSQWSRNPLSHLIGQLLTNASPLAVRCPPESLPLLYGVLLIQSLFVYAQEIFSSPSSSSFFLHWTRNLPELVLHSPLKLKELLPRCFPVVSPLVDLLCEELLSQLTSTRPSSLRLQKCDFEVPSSSSQFTSEWFHSRHPSLVFHFSLLDGQTTNTSLLEQFQSFAEKLNRLWHEKSSSSADELFRISFIHDQIHLLKERLPPPLSIPSNLPFPQHWLNVALFQVRFFFSSRMAE